MGGDNTISKCEGECPKAHMKVRRKEGMLVHICTLCGSEEVIEGYAPQTVQLHVRD